MLENHLFSQSYEAPEDDTRREQGVEFLNNFLKVTNIVRQSHQGGQGLAGNQCNSLLNKVDKLEAKMREQNLLVKGQQFIDAFHLFREVKESLVLGKKLLPDYKQKISDFAEAYRQLPGASWTPKIHILVRHVSEFLERQGGERGLGHWSEEAFEAMHYDFLAAPAIQLTRSN